MKTILFDIDKTLIKSLEREGDLWGDLFKEIYGYEGGIKNVASHGKTMKQIVFESLSKYGLDKNSIETGWSRFSKRLIEEYIVCLKAAKPFDDAKAVLGKLQERGFELGLITGNLKGIAFLKLKLAGLDNYFSFGGFGNNLTRSDALKEAVGGRNVSDCVVVGDTPQDIFSGKSLGLFSIGVSTGVYSIEELKSAGADKVICSLSELLEVLNE